MDMPSPTNATANEKPTRKRPMSNAETRAAFAAAGPCFVKPGEGPFKLPRVRLPAAPRHVQNS